MQERDEDRSQQRGGQGALADDPQELGQRASMATRERHGRRDRQGPHQEAPDPRDVFPERFEGPQGENLRRAAPAFAGVGQRDLVGDPQRQAGQEAQRDAAHDLGGNGETGVARGAFRVRLPIVLVPLLLLPLLVVVPTVVLGSHGAGSAGTVPQWKQAMPNVRG